MMERLTGLCHKKERRPVGGYRAPLYGCAVRGDERTSSEVPLGEPDQQGNRSGNRDLCCIPITS